MGWRHRQRLIWGFLGTMLVLFVAASLASNWYVDWLWFRTLGYLQVFWRSLAWRWLVGLAGGAVFAGIVFLNLWWAFRDAPPVAPQVVPLPYQRWFHLRPLSLILAGLAAVMGVMAGTALAQEWLAFAVLPHRVPFGVTDPLYGRDVGYYVFVVPVLTAAQQVLGGAVVFSLAGAVAAYGLTGRLRFDGRWLSVHPRARAHLSFLLGCYLLLKAAGYWLATYRLLYSERGVAYGASYTDINAQLPALKALVVLALVTAALAWATPFLRHYRLLLGGLGALLTASLVLGSAVPALVQSLVVRPNEIVKETPYIKLNIEYTRRAYNLDRIRELPFPAGDQLTAADLEQEAGTIGNIRLWDWRVLASAFQQLQGMRTYYQFRDTDVDVDRYVVDGRLRQVVLAAREIAYDKLPGKTWINQHLKYTHGYGVVVSPASEVTREGQPVLWVKDIPPVTAAAAGDPLRVERPEIYFGQHTDPYAIVGTREAEFDYPRGDANEYTAYRGRDGIPIGGVLGRLAFALWTGDYNVLFSRALTAESRALIYRNITDRLGKIAPFLLYDQDPYLVVARGRLFWIQDAYTVTAAYPYSEPFGGGPRFNYIRNAVKAVVDAYEGTVSFYLADPDDPLARAYAGLFPGLFRPLEEMDPALRAHLRYPEDLFLVQMQLYAKYHMTDPGVFYNKEDMWERPKEIVGADTKKLEDVAPYYVIMQLPGEAAPEFLLMVPFAPVGRQNMVAWLAARADGEQYGDLLVYKFPKQQVVYGPEQVEALINQNDAIAEKLNLWNQQGSQVQRGNLLVIPVRDALLYVEPVYLQSSSTKLPELRRVVVVHGNRAVMEETLAGALRSLFGSGGAAAEARPAGAGAAAAGGGAPDLERLRRAVADLERLSQEMQAALRRLAEEMRALAPQGVPGGAEAP